MLASYLSTLNYYAVLSSSGISWVLGMVWFTVLFGKTWRWELQKHGVILTKLTTEAYVTRLIQNLALNVMMAFGVAFIVFATNCSAAFLGFKIGLFTGICLSAASIAQNSTMENRSWKLLLIDAGYPVTSITISTIILSVWKLADVVA